MAQPIWLTPAGSLGTVPEGVFFQVPLLAEEPEGDPIFYQVIAGQLPPGVQCEETGLIVGVPKAIASIQGVPLDVSTDVTSKFAVRAYTKRVINGVTVINRLADRTFTLTVTGQDAPEFITPPGSIGTYYDGTQITDLQVEYTDTDPADNVIVKLAAGQLPPGLTLAPNGVISGFIQPESPIEATQGYSRDGQGYDEYSFDFSTRSVNVNYEFVLEVTDGKSSNLRTFTITVYSRDSLTADTTDFTADNTFITADVTPVRTPILLTPPGDLGRVRSDNFYAFKFDGIDLDGDEIRYELTLGAASGFDATGQGYDTVAFDRGTLELPPGLSLDPVTGWLYGYIPDLGLTENTYTFAIRVYEALNPDSVSDYYYFDITIIGAVDTEITWLTDSNLGTIDTGSVSLFYVAAVNAGGIPLNYRLQSGSDSSLPQGLSLLPSGDIAGRVSFNTFALDGGTTTFDVDNNDLFIDTPTTFDLTFNFTVEAYAASGAGNISTFKTFTIRINRAYNEPYENLYIQAMPPESDRQLIQSLLQNNQIIPKDLLFRVDDPNFGLAERVIYWHAYGLTSATYDEYISALYENHYWKNLVLGSVETAQATDSAGNVIYEVVYSRVVDNLVNDQGESVSKQVVLPYSINPGTATQTDVVYPNSLDNMRDQVIDTVGQISNILPRWMLSKQADGRVLGFTPAWVIAYTKPGKAKQIQYNIQQQFGTQLNKVDFEVDRYELDRLLSIHWNSTTQSWTPAGEETTFDRFGRALGITYIGNVDYGTDLAFSDINGRTLAYINSLGGIDGLVGGNLNGKKLIFVKQEDYVGLPQSYTPGLMDINLAWTRYTEPYSSVGYSNNTNLFDEAIVIPGQLAVENDPSLTNERMGIWTISVGTDNIVTLTLLENTVTNDYVTVVGGAKYKTAQLYRPSVPASGLFLINWQPLPSAIAEQTFFDGGSLRFIDPVDMYSNSTDFDRFLVFPYRTILGDVVPSPAPSPVVYWTNNNNARVGWKNISDQPVVWTNNTI